jgi:hypothetical protein
MENAFDTNTEVFSSALKVTEVQQSVLQQVLEDVFAGKVRVLDSSGRIDFGSYIQDRLNQLQKMEEDAAGPRTSAAPLIEMPTPEGVTVFGGG